MRRAGHDLYRMAEGLARTFDESLGTPCPSQGIGAHHPHTVGSHVAQPLSESLQACQRACGDIFVQAPIRLQPGPQPHHFAQSIEYDQLVVRIPRDHHVEAVGTQIYCG
jgi:hypothetical protein